MSVSHFIAMRYLKATQENRFFSWISFLSITGLAIGVAALIVVVSVINGFEHELRERFLASNAHIMVYRYPAGMENPHEWGRIIKKDFKGEVKGSSAFIHYETMLKSKNAMHGVLVRGIEPREREKVQSLKGLVQPDNALDQLQKEIDDAAAGKPVPDVPGIVVGSGLLGIMNAKVGDVIQLVSPSEEKYTELYAFKIVGVYNSGLKHYDNRLAAMSLVAAQRFFKMGNLVTGLEVGLNNPEKSIQITAKMDQKYNLTFREWQSFNSPLFEALEKERFVISLIVAMVTLVAAFNILTTIIVSVTQKQRDISILKALGATNRQIVGLFINQGIYIGIIGSMVGIVLALLISKALETYQFIDLPEPYILKNLPVHYSPQVYLSIALAAIFVCVIAGLYPAFIAARVQPTDGFRGTGDSI